MPTFKLEVHQTQIGSIYISAKTKEDAIEQYEDGYDEIEPHNLTNGELEILSITQTNE